MSSDENEKAAKIAEARKKAQELRAQRRGTVAPVQPVQPPKSEEAAEACREAPAEAPAPTDDGLPPIPSLTDPQFAEKMELRHRAQREAFERKMANEPPPDLSWMQRYVDLHHRKPV